MTRTTALLRIGLLLSLLCIDSALIPPPPSIPPFDYFLYPFRLRVTLKDVKEWMRASISIPADKLEPGDANLEEFSQVGGFVHSFDSFHLGCRLGKKIQEVGEIERGYRM